MESQQSSTKESSPTMPDSKPESTQATKQSSETPKENETQTAELTLMISMDIEQEKYLQLTMDVGSELASVIDKLRGEKYPDIDASFVSVFHSLAIKL